MQDYISISTLNDFIFCPYSIYLHNVYMGGDEELVHATPQAKGKVAHAAIDDKKYSSRKDDITSLSVYSNELGVIGKIDLYKGKEKLLIERKYQLNTIYQGQIYQLWAQYFCMKEMGYVIEHLAFYAISTNKTFPIDVPTEENKKELQIFIRRFKEYDPTQAITVNSNKCTHCIYCNLCDKIETENVYT
ncbi:MAG: type V CRISPR-associated protein Cas4 [Paludibacteraceae bacterium]|nr:type V CRISPR-associated protein Cas4 [Paludibacteraceae bacterium]